MLFKKELKPLLNVQSDSRRYSESFTYWRAHTGNDAIMISTLFKNNHWRLNFIILDNDAGCNETSIRFYFNIYQSYLHIVSFSWKTAKMKLTAVKREKFAKVEQSTLKLRLSFSLLSLIYHQYTVNLPNVLKVYQKSS